MLVFMLTGGNKVQIFKFVVMISKLKFSKALGNNTKPLITRTAFHFSIYCLPARSGMVEKRKISAHWKKSNLIRLPMELEHKSPNQEFAR